MKIATIILGATLAIASFATAAHASSRMLTTGSTSQPIGHALFCQQFAAECKVRSANDAPPSLTKKRWADLVEVNTYANRTIQPVTDQDYYGVEEHWTYPRTFGDCEDYALLKRYMLMQRGWPVSSLLITVVRQPNGDGHAVLTVRTDRGDFILDNMEAKIERWDHTPYKFLKRQSVTHSGAWSSIRDRRRSAGS